MRLFKLSISIRSVFLFLFISWGIFLCVGCTDAEHERQIQQEKREQELRHEQKMNQLQIELEKQQHALRMEEIDKVQKYETIKLEKKQEHEIALDTSRNEIARYIIKVALIVISALSVLISIVVIYLKRKQRDLEEQKHVDTQHVEQTRLIIEAVKDPNFPKDLAAILVENLAQGPRRVGQIEYIRDVNFIDENDQKKIAQSLESRRYTRPKKRDDSKDITATNRKVQPTGQRKAQPTGQRKAQPTGQRKVRKSSIGVSDKK